MQATFRAQVDDSRLVLRLIGESIAAGARALNYTTVTELLRNESGRVTGVLIKDTETRETRTLSSLVVINATGCWAEKLHPSPEPGRHLRPLRGSHLVFPADVLPISHGFGFMHPVDNRSVFVVPWEGAALVGTTDLDHAEGLIKEPTITAAEIKYLMQGLEAVFPSLHISLEDCIAAFAGVRPVLSEDDRPPSEESREHVVWVDQGLVTVTGGKLTTFRRLAWDALKAAKPFLPDVELPDKKDSIFSKVPDHPAADYGLPEKSWRRLYGRYGLAAETIVKTAAPKDLSEIPGTHTLWAELPFAARNERVRHLDDLLLRRVRIGLLTRRGGRAYFKRIRKLCRDALPWDRRRWKKEIHDYVALWNQSHALPEQRAGVRAERKFFIFRAIGSFFKSGAT